MAKNKLKGKFPSDIVSNSNKLMMKPIHRSRGKEDKMRECLISLVRIRVTCSTETPNERMGTSEIVMELKAIKHGFLGMVIH